jgi:hypothetical protein
MRLVRMILIFCLQVKMSPFPVILSNEYVFILYKFLGLTSARPKMLVISLDTNIISCVTYDTIDHGLSHAKLQHIIFSAHILQANRRRAFFTRMETILPQEL